MAREMGESGLGYYILPDVGAKEHYSRHVKMRAEFFCLLVHKVSLLCLKYTPGYSFERYLSDKADVQIDKGVYVGSMKIDAAHLCNTSFMSDRFYSDVGAVSPALRFYCDDLRILSGATVPQTKYDNVGPDKVIDSFQTDFKNWYLREFKKSPHSFSGTKLWQLYVTDLNLHLSNSASRSFTNPSASGYQGGLAASAMMASLMNGEISWSLEQEFRLAGEAIANLP